MSDSIRLGCVILQEFINISSNEAILKIPTLKLIPEHP